MKNTTNEDYYSEDAEVMTERRRKQPKTWKAWAAIALIVALFAALILSLSFFGYKWYESRNDPIASPGGDDDSTPSHYQEVSDDTMERLDDGTILTFGTSNTPRITLFVDPEDLSRDTTMVGGSPSDFFNAIKNRELSVNLYLSPSTPERAKAIDSVTKVAICLYGNDTTATKLPTLLKISDIAKQLQGDEDLDAAAALMGLDSDTQCAAESTEVATDTSNNVVHFMTQFKLDEPGFLISDGALITELDNLRPDWSDLASSGISADALLATKE